MSTMKPPRKVLLEFIATANFDVTVETAKGLQEPTVLGWRVCPQVGFRV